MGIGNAVVVGGISAGGTGSATPSGPAGGDLAGTYPNPTLADTANVDSIILAHAMSAFTSFPATTSATQAMVAGALYTANTGAGTFDLPATIAAGQVFGVQRGSSTASLTITPNSGQTINGGVSVSMAAEGANLGFVWLMATSTTNYIILAAVACDANQGGIFNGPLSVRAISFNSRFILHTTSVSATYTLAAADLWVICTANSFTVTLSSSNFSADQVAYITNAGTGTITLATSSGTLDNTSLPASSSVLVIFDGTNWRTIGSYGININSANRAVVSTQAVVSGTKFTPNTIANVELVIPVSLAGTITMTMGPSTGTENSILSSFATVAGVVITKTVPAGWGVIITLVTATLGTVTKQTL